MIVEYLEQLLGLNPLVNRSLTIALEVTALGLIFLLLGLLVFFMKKMRPWRDVISSTGGKLAIIIDSANQCFFHPIRSKHDFNFIAERGIRMFDKESTYFAPDQLTSVGVFISNTAITLPVKFHKFAGKKTTEAQSQLISPRVPLKAMNSEGKEVEVLPKLEQVNVWHFSEWLSNALNPKKWEADLTWRARKFGKINDLEQQSKQGFNWKILVIIGIVVVVAVVIFMFASGRG